MESFRKNHSANNSTKNMLVINFILIGLGIESAEKLFAFMVKKIKILDKQRRKKSKAVSCPKNNFFENFKTPRLLLSFHKCFSIASEEASLNLLTFLLLCLMNVTIVKETIHMQES